MKRILIPGLLALCLAAGSQQHASAWFKFGLGGSFNTGLAWGGHSFSLRCQEQPCPCYVPAPPPAGKPDAGKPEGAKSEASIRPSVYYVNPAVQSVGYAIPAFDEQPMNFFVPVPDFHIDD